MNRVDLHARGDASTKLLLCLTASRAAAYGITLDP
jgi:hypothetical protein